MGRGPPKGGEGTHGEEGKNSRKTKTRKGKGTGKEETVRGREPETEKDERDMEQTRVAKGKTVVCDEGLVESDTAAVSA